MPVHEFYKNLSIIDQKFVGKPNYFFLSCSESEWQAFISKYSPKSITHLLNKD